MTRHTVPAGPDEITSGWVSAILGRTVRIGPVVRIGEDYGFASELYRVEMLETVAEPLIVKLWDTTTRAGVRELRFYEHLAEESPIALPAFRAGAADAATNRAFLVVDELVGVRQGDVMKLEARTSLLRLAQESARLHARWWAADALSELPWLIDLRRSQREPEWFGSRTEMFRERFGALSAPIAREVLAHAVNAQALANEVLESVPSTLLHGDHHLDNIMFRTDGTPVFLDWAGAGHGPGVLDLVNLAFRMGHVADTTAALDAYFATLEGEGIDVDKEEWPVTVSAALLRQFITWTLGIAAAQMPTERGAAQVLPGISQAEAAIATWYESHPDLIDAALSK